MTRTAHRCPQQLSLVLLCVLALCGPAYAAPDPPVQPRAGAPVTIPTRCLGDRFAAVPALEAGGSLTFLADSAGGTFLFAHVADRLKLATTEMADGGDGAQKLRVTQLPAFKSGAAIPPPLGIPGGRLMVFESKPGQIPKFFQQYDGLLGQQWFAGRVWTFDYPARRLLLRAPGDVPRHDAAHEVKLGFRKLSSGERETNFARLSVTVDGEPIDFLLDTGATNLLPEKVLKEIGDGGPAERGTSFLARSQFEKWRKKHPKWRALDNVKTLSGTAMIEVPEVVIGGCTVGPVWFTVQPDSAFHKYMASMMDQPTEGALGGSAFRQMVVTVDWPNAIAVFERPK
ncbi:MAG TPA: hypothetical protein VGP76_08715 [Planctomycetaceae bacterium]|nr:hypothetical protein [Planctomycetaceae bacterium]